MIKKLWRCKFCLKEFKDREEAERHGVGCGQEFERVKINDNGGIK